MIKIKKGVHGVYSNKMFIATNKIKKVYRKFHTNTLWITSIADGKHKIDSKHYDKPYSNAIDYRIWNVLNSLVREIKKELGPDYDVVLEKDHLHVEYDPK